MTAAALITLAALVPVLLAWRAGTRAIDAHVYGFAAREAALTVVHGKLPRATPANDQQRGERRLAA